MTNEELLKVINETKESGVTELDLSRKRLTELPPEIGQLLEFRPKRFIKVVSVLQMSVALHTARQYRQWLSRIRETVG